MKKSSEEEIKRALEEKLRRERKTASRDPFVRAENEDDDGYDPYSDRRPAKEPLFQHDPWAYRTLLLSKAEPLWARRLLFTQESSGPRDCPLAFAQVEGFRGAPRGRIAANRGIKTGGGPYGLPPVFSFYGNQGAPPR